MACVLPEAGFALSASDAGSASLLSPSDVRVLADKLYVTPTKRLGQNFVHDANTVRRIVQRAGLSPEDHVLEVGPGLGSLTLGLLDVAAHVTAIEIDPLLADELPTTVAERSAHAGKLTVVNADALDVDSVEGEPTAFVANLPYNVAVPVLLHLMANVPSLKKGLVMVQKEVADRLAAGPGSKTYGVPSVKAAWFAEVSRDMIVPRGVFWPVPNVDSALVKFTSHDAPVAPGVSRTDVFAVIDAAFGMRRKTLRAALARWAGSPQQAEAVLNAAGVSPQARGETLTVQDFARIAAHKDEA